MSDMSGSPSESDLRAAFARESEAAMRYRFFAQQADVEGRPELSQQFRLLADAATGHALGFMDLLAELPDPDLGHSVDEADDAVASTRSWESLDHLERYPEASERARSAGFDEVADWFDAVIKAPHPTHFDT